MNTKITENDIALVMNALAGQPIVTTSEFADKIEKILKNYDDLKDMFIEEKMYRVKEYVPYGHCPYSYLSFDNDVECGDLECDECKKRYFEDYEKNLRKDIDQNF